MSSVTREDRDRVAILTWDEPGRPVNTKHAAAIAALSAALETALADPGVAAIVLTSGKAHFAAGGDLEELRRVASPAEVLELVRPVGALLGRLEGGGKPVVAAIRGQALGGGLELALACHGRVADPSARFAMPELGLGLMPGAGGTQRLPRLVGLRTALEMIVDGKTFDAQTALAAGLVDAVVEPGELLDTAIARARATPATQRWLAKDAAIDPPVHSPKGRALIERAWVRAKTRGPKDDPAPDAALMAIHHGLERGLEAGLAIEARHFARLAASPEAKNRIRTLFVAQNEARSIRTRPPDEPLFRVQRLAVVGAGLMGGGIAFTAASAGIAVTLIDRDADASAAALGRLRGHAERLVGRGHLERAAADRIVSLVETGSLERDLSDVDAAVEAVVEVEGVKAEVLRRLGDGLRPGTLLASNTSTMRIGGLARHAPRPGEFVGLHFFAPVDRMPLLEVVRGEATTDATLARALDLAKALRKIPVVVNDGIGFFTSRVVGAYTGEALTLLAEGVDPVLVDEAATAAGMPLGPLAMADMTGLRVLVDIFASLRGDGHRPANAGSRAEAALAALTGAGRFGRAEGGGIYEHPREGRPRPWPGLGDLFPPAATPPAAAEVGRRLMYAQSLEAARALEEGIVARPGDADLASVLGWSFPKTSGGVLSHVDTVGAARVVAESDALAARHGPRFVPPPGLRAMAMQGGRYHDT